MDVRDALRSVGPAVGAPDLLSFIMKAAVEKSGKIEPKDIDDVMIGCSFPEAEQGRISGDLVFYAEIVLLVACGVAGILADRWGRRAVFAAGFALLALGFAVYGFVDGYSELLLLRLFL